MKVTPFVSPPATRPNSAAAASGRVSFAAFLASGRSIADITSGRALGFSETGIMGVYRGTSQIAGPPAETIRRDATAPTATKSDVSVGPHLSLGPSQIVSKRDGGTICPTRSEAPAAGHLGPRIDHADSQGAACFTTLVNRQATREATDTKTALLSRGLLRLPQIPERRRVLSAVLVDSEGVMLVNAAVSVGAENLSDEVRTEIEKVSLEFRMTLKHISIDGKQVARFTIEVGEDNS